MPPRHVRFLSTLVLAGLIAAVPAAAQLAPSPDPSWTYTPPACTGTYFLDVTCSTPFDAWIEQFVRDGITAGCGGGNYCPGSPVTRDQMAVFIEKAMRGTSNWPPNTVLVHAVLNADGSMNATASGTALLAAFASIPASGARVPSVTNPWLVKIGPGIFDLGTSALTMRQHVSIQGSGQKATFITATGDNATINGANNCELSHLSVWHNGGTTSSRAIFNATASPTIRFVSAEASGTGTEDVIAIENSNATPRLSHVEAVATGVGLAFGVRNQSCNGIVIEDLHAASYNGPAVASYSSTVTMARVDAFGQGENSVAIHHQGGSLTLTDSKVSASGNGTDALFLSDAPGTLARVDATSGSGTAYALNTSSAAASRIVTLDNCRLAGINTIRGETNYSIRVGGSLLSGGAVSPGAGTITCAGVWDESYAFYPSTCP